jgi:hypothetical protein
MSPIIQKLGKSKRGRFTKEQREYVDRCCAFGCLPCYIGRGISETPGNWHHAEFHGAGMRGPHEHGFCCCPFDHTVSDESVHRNPTAFAAWVGMTEAQLVALSMRMFGWKNEK